MSMTIPRLAAGLEPLQLSIAEAESHPAINEASRFVRRNTSLQSAEFSCLKILLMAKRLGVSAEAMDEEANPGFFSFAEQSYIYRYILFHGGEVNEDPETHELELLYQGEYVKWSRIPKEILNFSYPKPYQPIKYDSTGIVDRNAYEWEELPLLKKVAYPPWPGYILAFCYNFEKDPRCLGDHAWYQIRRPTGEIYSTGFYRLDNENRDFREKTGAYQAPDYSEFYKCNKQQIEVRIPEETFNSIKTWIEGRKKLENSIRALERRIFNENYKPNEEEEALLARKKELRFHERTSNCVMDANKVAALAGIRFPTVKRGWRLLAPRPVVKGVDAVKPLTPEVVQTACDYGSAFFVNFLLYMLKDPGTPLIKVFDPENSNFHHPHTFSEIYLEVMEWRKRQKESLVNPTEEELKEIDYKLPPYYYISSPA